MESHNNVSIYLGTKIDHKLGSFKSTCKYLYIYMSIYLFLYLAYNTQKYPCH